MAAAVISAVWLVAERPALGLRRGFADDSGHLMHAEAAEKHLFAIAALVRA